MKTPISDEEDLAKLERGECAYSYDFERRPTQKVQQITKTWANSAYGDGCKYSTRSFKEYGVYIIRGYECRCRLKAYPTHHNPYDEVAWI